MLTQLLWDRRGGSITEFAITAPLLFLMALGAGDFARVTVEAAQMEGAANAGATWDYRTVKDAVDYQGIQNAVLTDAIDVSNVSATAERLCDCPDAPGAWVSCTQSTCSGYGVPRVYVRARATKTFSTLGRYPGVPSRIPLSAGGYMRVQ
ncbi:MAG: TadE/TadG family type IV pilus assembly protein [Bryobacterales bacterium]